MDGRKTPKKYDNFFDYILIEITQKLNSQYKKYNLTPNHLTFLSLIITLISEYFFYKNKYFISFILFLLGYFFDCADGNYARATNMVTVFGDYFDHISDFLKILILIFLFKLKLGLEKKFYILVCLIIILTLFMSIHIGCQQKNIDTDNSQTLNHFKFLCPDKSLIKYTKFFGVGTFQLSISLIILFFNVIENF